MAKKKQTKESPQWSQIALFLLRVSLGWLFLYSGLMKIADPTWSAAGFLGGAKTFPALYDWFSSASNIGWVNFLNAWGQTLIGFGLITGTLVTLFSWAGILMMLLYYFPTLEFPYVAHGFIVDEHIVYALAFFVLVTTKAGRFWGVDKYLSKKK